MDDMKYNAETLAPIEFAIVKEDIRLGRTYEDISKEYGLTATEIEEINSTKYFKEYRKEIQDPRVIQRMIEEEARAAGL